MTSLYHRVAAFTLMAPSWVGVRSHLGGHPLPSPKQEEGLNASALSFPRPNQQRPDQDLLTSENPLYLDSSFHLTLGAHPGGSGC